MSKIVQIRTYNNRISFSCFVYVLIIAFLFYHYENGDYYWLPPEGGAPPPPISFVRLSRFVLVFGQQIVVRSLVVGVR